MKRIAILIRSGHELDVDTRIAITHLRAAHFEATEDDRRDIREQVCRYVWIDDNAELDAAMKILSGTGISAIRA